MLVRPPHEGLALVGHLSAVYGDAVDDDADGFVQRVDGVVFVPDDPAVELAALGRCACKGPCSRKRWQWKKR